ncbi:hypothetical protein K440DRAFT_648028 [Wilcoxina mikolae CBS 423.85]|nr:hypothetical protein K440DRAFT_648028 [Wilcoxina mikolae CBS 423.85]
MTLSRNPLCHSEPIRDTILAADISVHAGSSKLIDFLQVLEGFERNQDAVVEVKAQLNCSSEGFIGQLSTVFDRGKIKESGILIPETGIEPNFDETRDIIEGIVENMNERLKTYMKELRCRNLKFVDFGLELFTVEIPINTARHIPKTWQQISGTSKSLEEAQETQGQIDKEVTYLFYQGFDEDYQSWLLTVHTIANFDLVSCQPTFVGDKRTVLRFEELHHPCIVLPSVKDFIPNDIKLGGNYFANGMPTISRVLSETQKILNNTMPRLLVIIDELRCGMSTYDSISVTQSVLHHIATHIRCVGYSATNYHYLVAESTAHLEIRRDITFLYQLEKGAADWSFGMHCAAKCGINRRIIDRVGEVAKKYEHASKVNVKNTSEAARMDSLIPLSLQRPS